MVFPVRVLLLCVLVEKREQRTCQPDSCTADSVIYLLELSAGFGMLENACKINAQIDAAY
jgi:hypothetical protein